MRPRTLGESRTGRCGEGFELRETGNQGGNRSDVAVSVSLTSAVPRKKFGSPAPLFLQNPDMISPTWGTVVKKKIKSVLIKCLLHTTTHGELVPLASRSFSSPPAPRTQDQVTRPTFLGRR